MTDVQETAPEQNEADSKATEGNPSEAEANLGDAGKQAIDRMKAERNAARNELKSMNAELEKFRKADQDKAEADKTEAEKRAAAEQRAVDAELRATRLEVAHEKGLTPAQAKRLVGSTREELEADADEVLRDFPVTSAPAPKPAPKPDPSQGAKGETRTRAKSLTEAIANARKPASGG